MIELGELLGQERINLIKSAVNDAEATGETSLKPIKMRLPEEVSYGGMCSHRQEVQEECKTAD